MKLKFAFLILGLGLFALMAFTPTKKATNQEKQLTFQLSVSETEQLLTIVQKEPMKDVIGLFNKIYSQAQRQLSDTTKKK
jgi:hypothetical protein